MSSALLWSASAWAAPSRGPVLAEPVFPGPGPIQSQWGALRPEVAKVLREVLEEHRKATSEPMLLRVGSVPGENRKQLSAAMLKALEGAKLGGARRNGVLLWIVPEEGRGGDALAGVALGFAVDGVWPFEEREAWIEKRVLPALRRGRVDQAAGTLVWGALQGIESPIIQKNDVRARLEKVEALVLEELPEDGGVDRGIGVSGAALTALFVGILGVLAWIFAVAAGGEREFEGVRWRRIPLPQDLWGRLQQGVRTLLARVRQAEASPKFRIEAFERGSPSACQEFEDLPSSWFRFQRVAPIQISFRKTQSRWDRDLSVRCQTILASAPYSSSQSFCDAVLLIHPKRKTSGWAERDGAPSRSALSVEDLEFLRSLLQETQFETALAVFLGRWASSLAAGERGLRNS